MSSHPRFHRLGRVVLLGLLAAALILPAQAADASFRRGPKPTLNLIQTLEADGRFGTLLFALEATGLKDVVAEADALTVFAPTDAAFDALPDGVLDDLVGDPDALEKVLLYHVLAGDLRSRTLTYRTTFTTLQGQPIVAIRDDGSILVNGIEILIENVRATNGRAHVIGEVLIPAEEDFVIESLVDVLALDGRFTTLIDLVVTAGLADTAINGGPFTLFAPTDDAFALLGQDTLDALKDDIPKLQEILTYHLLDGKQSIVSLFLQGGAATLQGSRVDVGLTRDGLKVNDSEVSGWDARAPNATIQVIEQVLLPPAGPDASILNELAEGGYTTLVAAIEAAGIAEDLLALGPVTILAPTNEAFAALGQDTIDALLADPETLSTILLYHVIPSEKSIIEMLFERETETALGPTVRTKFAWFQGIFINGARVVEFDRELTGATVQGLDEVLLPPGL
jgi:uncharacterized surface protein with fasciclin (FAS1) repeats